MKKMIRLGLVMTIAIVMHVTTSGNAAPKPAEPLRRTHQFRCTDRNTSLYFLVYETDGALEAGQFYVENMQSGQMSVEWAGKNFIKAHMEGNPANVAFLLGRDGNVMVANYATSTRTRVCRASYVYR